MLSGYERTLVPALSHPRLVMLILFGAIALNVYLLIIVPKGFFPQQDTGRITGVLRGDQSVSFQAMRKKLVEMIAITRQDPDVENVIGFTGVGSGGNAAALNTASVYVNLKPLGVAQSLRRRNHRTLAAEAGAAAGRGDFPHRHPGFSRRRAPEQRRISIHLARRRPRTVFLDAEARRGLAARPRASRRKFGPAAEGAGVGCRDRSRHRLSAGAQRGADRQHAL